MAHRDFVQDNNYRPGSWKRLALSAGGRSASFTCPNGHHGSLIDHRITEDGTVDPSVVCPEGGCNFHEYIRLVGWRLA